MLLREREGGKSEKGRAPIFGSPALLPKFCVIFCRPIIYLPKTGLFSWENTKRVFCVSESSNFPGPRLDEFTIRETPYITVNPFLSAGKNLRKVNSGNPQKGRGEPRGVGKKFSGNPWALENSVCEECPINLKFHNNIKAYPPIRMKFFGLLSKSFIRVE